MVKIPGLSKEYWNPFLQQSETKQWMISSYWESVEFKGSDRNLYFECYWERIAQNELSRNSYLNYGQCIEERYKML